jgi:pyrimidine deaminase RibD-like protein
MRAGPSAEDLRFMSRALELALAQLGRTSPNPSVGCVIVANDEPTSMTDAYAFIKVLRGYAPSVQPWIAINMADTRVAGRRTYEALARASHDLERQPMAVFLAAAELVRAIVGASDGELVDQVALGAHDLDAVETGMPGQFGAAHIVFDGLPDLRGCQGPRRAPIDR